MVKPTTPAASRSRANEVPTRRATGSPSARARTLDFATICKTAVKRCKPAAAQSPTVYLSLAPMAATECVSVAVPIQHVAQYLNAVGQDCAAAGIADVQVWIQRRKGKRKEDPAELHGVIIDIDEPHKDLLAVIGDIAAPVPNVIWQTANGWRAAYVFSKPVDAPMFERIGRQLTLALPGGDPSSWLITQGQRLPVAIKTTPAGPQPVTFTARMTNPVPLDVAAWRPEFPPRLARLVVGAACLTVPEREVVEAHLEEIGIPAPAEPGREMYDACPVEQEHDTRCCYVNRADDGRIWAVCLGGHEGAGQMSWSEVHLFVAATERQVAGIALDAVRDIPPTWAGVEFLAERLGEGFKDVKFRDRLVEAGVETWKLARAQDDFESWVRRAEKVADGKTVESPTLEDFLAVTEERLRGLRRGGCFAVYYDTGVAMLRLYQPDGSAIDIRVKADTLNPQTHAHEFMASLAYAIKVVVVEKEKNEVIAWDKKIDRAFVSEFNKALSGHRGCLRALGFPKLKIYELPVAFVEPKLEIERDGLITGVRIVHRALGDASFDTMQFFLGLFRAGRLPLVSEEDVGRLVMAIASPFLRSIAPGLLGVYWVLGPSGAGKDFLAELIADIWEALAPSGGRAKFDVTVSEDLEHKREFFGAAGAVYARVKEAGKRAAVVEQVIRFAGTDRLSARGMRRDDTSIPNTFTFLADSAEDLPDRKEISRRTIPIRVVSVDDKKVSLGEVRKEVVSKAPDILANLKALVETQTAAWFLGQKNTGARPVIPVALAALLKVSLPKVEGRDLDELVDAMLDYTSTAMGQAEGAAQRTKARPKDGKAPTVLPSYRLTHLIDMTAAKPGCKQLFDRGGEFSTPPAISKVIQRELVDIEWSYSGGSETYKVVTVNGIPHALKLVRSGRNFILVPEAQFHSALTAGVAAPGAVAAAAAASTATKAPAAPPSSTVVGRRVESPSGATGGTAPPAPPLGPSTTLPALPLVPASALGIKPNGKVSP